jgi:hypothetical protein
VNILDENIRADQRQRLRDWRIHVRQIGLDIGWKGVLDDGIIPLLRRCRSPTLFTRDRGFYDRSLCSGAYCLIMMSVEKTEVAEYVRRLLRHPELNTQAKRMGAVVRLSPTGLTVWRVNADAELKLDWPTR